MTEALFPELEREQARLGYARACRDEMIERLSSVDPEGAADTITKEKDDIFTLNPWSDPTFHLHLRASHDETDTNPVP